MTEGLATDTAAEAARNAERIAQADAALADGRPQDALVAALTLLGDPQQHRAALRKVIAAHLALRDPAAARPYADRLRRIEPPSPDDLTLAGLVLLHCADQAGISLLRRALELDPRHAMAARSLQVLHGATPAPAAVAALLWHAEVDADCAATLRGLCAAAPGARAVVWPTAGRIVGHVAHAGLTTARLLWEGRLLAEIACRPNAAGVADISFVVPSALAGKAALTVEVPGVAEVLGSPIAPAATTAPRFEGSVDRDEEFLHLRARNAAAPDRPVAVTIAFPSGRQARHVFPATPATDLTEVPALAVPLADTAGLRVTFEATGEPFCAQPLPGLSSESSSTARLPVDVIVPVYGDFAATGACLESLLAASPGLAAEFIVIDDDTPDPRIAALLDRLAAEGRITLLRNPGNLGFVRSVNRGMALHPDRDVVLLNADTVVADGWLVCLHRAACRADDIATVTPLSNDATILSYPDGESPVALDSIDVAALNAQAARTLGDALVDIPTAIGFCMFIKRACLDQVGYFDAALFGDGYGEENDFCCRATAIGWRHVAALGAFVGHAGGASFGSSKAARIRQALAKLATRFPDYGERVEMFLAGDPLRAARRELDLTRLRDLGPRPALVICPELGGGTDRFVREQLEELSTSGYPAIVLRAQERAGTPQIVLELPGSIPFPNLIYDADGETESLLRDLRNLGVRHTVLHHLMGLAPDVAAMLAAAFPYQVHIHDYSWICPRINLVDGSGRYCGEPQVAICERCVAENGAEIAAGMSVAAWRDFTRHLLDGAQAVLCPTTDTAIRIGRYAPASSLAVVPHSEAPVEQNPPNSLPPAGRRRVAVIGAINEVKGYDVLRACAEDAARRDLPLEFVLIGYSQDDLKLFETGRIFVTGRYKEGEGAALARAWGCAVGFLPSVWPETWCYALTEMWRAGLEVVAFDLGAQAERSRDRDGMRLVPLGMMATELNDVLLA